VPTPGAAWAPSCLIGPRPEPPTGTRAGSALMSGPPTTRSSGTTSIEGSRTFGPSCWSTTLPVRFSSDLRNEPRRHDSKKSTATSHEARCETFLYGFKPPYGRALAPYSEQLADRRAPIERIDQDECLDGDR